MAVAYTASANAAFVVTAGTYPQSKSVPITASGLNTCILIGITIWDGVGNTLSDDASLVESVTYDGNACTFLGTIGNNPSMQVWYYVGAVNSSKNVVVTYNDSDGLFMTLTSAVTVVAFSGVDQSSPIAEHSGATGTGTTASKAMTIDSVNNGLVDFTIVQVGSISVTITENGAGTQRATITAGTQSARGVCRSSTLQGASGSQTMSYSISSSRSWRMYVAELKEAVASASRLRTLMGAGV